MNSNEYVKFITQTFVKYIEQPKDERKKHRQVKKDDKAPALYRWFGVLPYIFYYGFRRREKK
ncbi:YqzE-like protein [Cytobacillus horneckiae]|uniref:YqzE family protein n=1 Tax=Cytobacillus horneckiae TaxID=549687 RepID=A0A2N0ZHB3_9BACI|nr:YqzE family protein [Cytobacillus horneckiae]MBN6888845.1 YqzE family protein [Cytobacillus horneckiae]MCM3179974.1 YqzE family protein [Cytobacillus horneckiae]MEC1155363.1 YqzE family protein [Cytobacillus horneckiae]MED2936584.1 YqzE family protein [Cytobacillus horneckiae]PKG28881.1 YqzE family protein [Cytobacillus horneckiae]